MPDDNKYILASIQEILDEHNGFILFSQLPSMMSRPLRDTIGVKRNVPTKILRKKLEPVLEGTFVLHKKGAALYVMTPCDPEDLVLSVLSKTPQTLSEIGHVLKPFRKAEVAAIITELVNSGRAKIFIDGYSSVKFLASDGVKVAPKREAVSVSSGDYSVAVFKAAFNRLDGGSGFVRIPDLRRALSWPRDAFDNMLRTLRNNGSVHLDHAQQERLTKDELADCFTDENGSKMGLMNWND